MYRSWVSELVDFPMLLSVSEVNAEKAIGCDSFSLSQKRIPVCDGKCYLRFRTGNIANCWMFSFPEAATVRTSGCSAQALTNESVIIDWCRILPHVENDVHQRDRHEFSFFRNIVSANKRKTCRKLSAIALQPTNHRRMWVMLQCLLHDIDWANTFVCLTAPER